MVENLLWILDGPSSKGWNEEENEKRISFVHALGQKCDSVGWSHLDLADSNSDNILAQIKKFCDENGWKARGYYSRGYHITDSPWYRLNGEAFKETELADMSEFLTDSKGRKIRLEQIKAYAVLRKMPKSTYFDQCVSEEFLKECDDKNLKGMRCCWLKDVGRYRGTQYFAIAPKARVPRIMCDRDYSYKVHDTAMIKALPIYKRIQELGGSLPRVAEIFTTLDIKLDSCFLKKDMPDTYFAYGYLSPTYSYISKNEILLRRDAVEILISCKVLTERQLCPVYISDNPIPGYSLEETVEKPFPAEDILEKRLADYHELVNKNRPQRTITEKDAIKALKYAKKNRKEDFSRALPKKQRELLAETGYAALGPYYAICEAGYLNDEYRLLSYKESLAESQYFREDMAKEETKCFSTDGIIIAVCPDGDKIMLMASDEVYRISHEVPEIIGQWSSLACFIAESVI